LLDPAIGWAATATGSVGAAVLCKVAVKIASVAARQAVSWAGRVIRMGGYLRGGEGELRGSPNVTNEHAFCIARE
jgi:hypothetical protein